MVLGGPKLTSGSTSGSVSVTDISSDDDDDSGSGYSASSDPFGGGSGGKSGSEIIAEGGGASSSVTIDSSNDSMDEVIEDKGASGALGTISDLAQDGNDSNSAPTFDSVPDTEAGKEAVTDTAKSVVETAKSMSPTSSEENSDEPSSDVPQSVTAARNAASAFNAGSLPTSPSALIGGGLGLLLTLLTIAGALLGGDS